VLTGEGADILPGNALPIRLIPPGHAGSQLGAFSGTRWPSGALGRGLGSTAEQRRRSGAGEIALGRGKGNFRLDCMATIGQIGNLDHENQTYGKAARRDGWAFVPQTRRGHESSGPSRTAAVRPR